MSDLLAKLSAPFPPNRISWRVGSTNQEKTKGLALAYIDSRDVQERLDSVCGAENWQCRYPHASQKTVCEIGIRINDEWIWKADGAGDSDVEAEKGAMSDAFKRAAVKWGIGRYLYDLESPWVSLVAKGRSHVISDSEYDRLNKILLLGKKAPEPPPPSPKGISAVKAEITEAVREINACQDSDQLMIFLELPETKKLAVKVCRDFHSEWQGQEQGSGLRGMIEKAGNALEVAPGVGNWIRKAEAAATIKQAAE